MSSEHVIVEKKNSAYWITLSKQKRLNAIDKYMYSALIKAFIEAENDPEVNFTVIRAVGHYYSAGSDFSPAEFADVEEGTGGMQLYKEWVDKLIEHPKPVIAIIQGHAVGIAVTTLALFDSVIVCEDATFFCPFSQLGLVAEACSSKTFVDIMGYQRAARMLLFSEKLTAKELLDAGLIAKILPKENFNQLAEEIVTNYQSLAHESMRIIKRLMRPESVIQHLKMVNATEQVTLAKKCESEETIERMLAKFAKSKM